MKWQPTPVFWPGKSHGQRSLAGYSLWGHKRVRHNLATKPRQWKWKPLSRVRPFETRRVLQARILEWVAFPVSRGSSQRRDQTQVSRIAGRFFTSWATRGAQTTVRTCLKYPRIYSFGRPWGSRSGIHFFFLWHAEHLPWEERVVGNSINQPDAVAGAGSASSPPPFRDSRTSPPSLGASGCPSYWRKLGYKQSPEIWIQTSQFGPHLQISWAVLLNLQWI